MERLTKRWKHGLVSPAIVDYCDHCDADCCRQTRMFVVSLAKYEDEAEQREQECAILLDAIKTFGSEYQIDRAIEKLAELTQALLKYRRAGDVSLDDALKNVHEEIVDVQIVLEQLKMLFAYDKSIEHFKIERLKEMIADAQESRSAD